MKARKIYIQYKLKGEFVCTLNCVIPPALGTLTHHTLPHSFCEAVTADVLLAQR